MPFVFPKPISSNKDHKNLIKTNTAIILLLFGLSPVCNRYPKGSHTAWATKCLIIAFEEVGNRICKE